MPKLPKPKRISLDVAREYIQDIFHLENPYDADPTFYDALCNGELYFEGELNIPANYDRMITSSKAFERIPVEFWIGWSYEEFKCGGAINKNEICLPDIRYKPNAPFYRNLTIATADIDTWFNSSQDPRVSVSAVPEKLYKERVEKAVSIGIRYSRAEDRAWAADNRYSIPSVDAARNEYAPKEWSLKGRPKSPKETAGKTAD